MAEDARCEPAMDGGGVQKSCERGKCSNCDGKGWLESKSSFYPDITYMNPCPKCNATGRG